MTHVSATYDRSAAWPSSFSGVIAAVSTPMQADLAIDTDKVPAYVEFLLAHGAGALMVAGTTGEFIALEPDERVRLVRAFVRAVAGRVPVVAHVGHVDYRVARRLAEAAAADGADALAGIVPYFHRVTEGALEARLVALARVARQLPFLVYDYPDATGNRLEPGVFRRLLDEPNIHGIKLSVATWEEIETYLSLDSEILAVCGNDGLMERFVTSGGRAIVSGNAAALPDVVVAAWKGFHTSNPGLVSRARDLICSLVPLTLAGSADRLKEVLALRGMDIGPARIVTYQPADGDSGSTAVALRSICAAAEDTGLLAGNRPI